MFILVIWQRCRGTDESEAGRSCFATFPSPPHCTGFPGLPLLLLSLLLCPVGALLPGMGEQSLMEKQSLGLGNDPWDRGVIPGICVVILGQIPGGAKQISWVLPAS